MATFVVCNFFFFHLLTQITIVAAVDSVDAVHPDEVEHCSGIEHTLANKDVQVAQCVPVVYGCVLGVNYRVANTV